MKITTIHNPRNKVPNHIFDALDLPKDAYIVGGAARIFYQEDDITDTESDIDIAFNSYADMVKYIKLCRKEKGWVVEDYTSYFEADTYISYVNINGLKYKINILGLHYGNIEHQFGHFDLSPTQVAYDHRGNLHHTEAFRQAIDTNIMEFVNFNKIWCSTADELQRKNHVTDDQVVWKQIYSRVEKYNDKGFKSGNTIVKKILQHV